MKFNLNGKTVELEPLPGETLAAMLRERLHLTGTRIGCEEAECGACTVPVDDLPVLSCSYPAVRVDGRQVITIEGLSSQAGPSDLHPLQRAFIDHGAVQCGFCTPGQLLTAWSLLKNNPSPTDQEIRNALKDTLCRCGSYPAILRAIQSAAAVLRGEPARPAAVTPSRFASDHSVIGHSVPRPDASEKVTGTAIFTDDIVFDNMLHARVKRAGVPHAFLRSLDVETARRLPGVMAILTADDIPGDHNHGIVIPDWPVMIGIGERIRTVGDAIAIVAAETRDIASQALDAIQAEFELLPIIGDAVTSREESAISLHPGGNMLKHIKVRKGLMEQGFAEADVILEHTFHTAITDHAFLEPECSVAQPLDDGRMEVYVGSQIPYADRDQVARALGIPDNQVRVIGQLMGGGFGGKEDIAGQIHAALLAQATRRPVKLLFDRHESLLVHPKRHATQIRVRMGAKQDGSLVAIETELYGDTGAYASLGEKVLTRATTHSSGPYEVPNARADCYAMYTNNPPAGAFRGFGVTQSAFAIESMMDMLAENLTLDPVELRRKNALRPGSITNTGQLLRESVGLLECIDKVDAELRQRAGEHPFEPRSDARKPHLVRAWGFSAAYKNTGLGGGAPDKAGAELELRLDGTFQIRTASAELGQGLVTILQMIVAEEFSQSLDQIDVLVMDTARTPDGGPTTASRQTFVTGNAARQAASSLKGLLTVECAELYDTPPDTIRFMDGSILAGDRTIQLSTLAGDMESTGRPRQVAVVYLAPETKPLGEGGDMHFAFSFAAQAAEVEVNTQTGEVKVLHIISATDAGAALNPLGLQGQIEGGIVMGIGNALTERFIVEDGIVVTDRLARYRVPNITQVPEMTTFIVEHPVASGPYGGKGVGEIVSIPTTPAITNAIYNAVKVRVDSLPVDQEQIVRMEKLR